MKKYTFKLIALIGLGLASFTACDEDDEPTTCCLVEANDIQTPATYEFTRNEMTSVSYSGQTDRLNQVAEMKTYIGDAISSGTHISSSVLSDMFENKNDNGGGNFSFSSTKQLSNKTFEADRQVFVDMFAKAQVASDSAMNNVTAQNGKPGILLRNSGNKMLVDELGHEFTQELEKGLMGAVFYNQIVNLT